MQVVAQRLGHTSVTTTLSIYAHVLPAMDDQAADRFAAQVWNPSPPEGRPASR